MVGRVGDHLGDAVNDVRDEAHQLVLGVQHKRDDVGLACPQAHARAVRTIADLLGDELDATSGLGADLGRILQRARDRSDAKPGHEGKRLQRRPFLARRVVVALLRYPSIHSSRPSGA
jgi:hypothetical protein